VGMRFGVFGDYAPAARRAIERAGEVSDQRADHRVAGWRADLGQRPQRDARRQRTARRRVRIGLERVAEAAVGVLEGGQRVEHRPRRCALEVVLEEGDLERTCVIEQEGPSLEVALRRQAWHARAYPVR